MDLFLDSHGCWFTIMYHHISNRFIIIPPHVWQYDPSLPSFTISDHPHVINHWQIFPWRVPRFLVATLQGFTLKISLWFVHLSHGFPRFDPDQITIFTGYIPEISPPFLARFGVIFGPGYTAQGKALVRFWVQSGVFWSVMAWILIEDRPRWSRGYAHIYIYI